MNSEILHVVEEVLERGRSQWGGNNDAPVEKSACRTMLLRSLSRPTSPAQSARSAGGEMRCVEGRLTGGRDRGDRSRLFGVGILIVQHEFGHESEWLCTV